MQARMINYLLKGIKKRQCYNGQQYSERLSKKERGCLQNVIFTSLRPERREAEKFSFIQ